MILRNEEDGDYDAARFAKRNKNTHDGSFKPSGADSKPRKPKKQRKLEEAAAGGKHPDPKTTGIRQENRHHGAASPASGPADFAQQSLRQPPQPRAPKPIPSKRRRTAPPVQPSSTDGQAQRQEHPPKQEL